MAIFVSLTLLDAIAAIALARRWRAAGETAELVVAASIIGYALILVPIYALGAAHRLTAVNLAVASVLLALATLGASALGEDPRVLARGVLRDVLRVLRVPLDATRIAWRSRGFALLAVLAAMALVLWSAVSAYYAPSAGWDAISYHEPIVGFTIQNHGFGATGLPDTLQRINGYPRALEMMQLWCVIFVDRRLIDLGGVLAIPALIGATYLLCMRASGSRAQSLAWSSVLLFVPAGFAELRSATIDVPFAALLLACGCLVARPTLRLTDAWLAQIALAIAIGCKYQALAPAAALGVLLWFRVLRAHARERRAATALCLGGGTAIVLAMAAATYLRNYALFQHPFWPNVVAKGSGWPGWPDHGQTDAGGVGGGVPLAQRLKELFSSPLAATRDGTPSANYGLAVPWVVIPLATLALFALPVAWLRAPRGSGAETRARMLLFACAPAAVMLFTSPSPFTARLNLYVVGAALAPCAWFLHAALGSARAGSAATAVATALGMMTAWWGDNLVTLDCLKRLRAAPRPEREVRTDLGAPVNYATGTARDSELGPGSIVTFNDVYAAPGLYWNERYSNVVVYLPSGPDYLAAAQALGARWVYCAQSDPCFKEITLPESRWEPVGELAARYPGRAYRRKPPR